MPSYKVLTSIAHNFGHSFTSLMNYRADDYVMGHLLRTARQTGEPKLRVDILAAKASPDALLIPPVQGSIHDHCLRFPELVARQGSDIALIGSAVMEISFDLGRRRPVPDNPRFEESPYTCRVEIVDNRGKPWLAELRDWWYPESGGVVDPPYERLRRTTVKRLGQVVRSVWRPK